MIKLIYKNTLLKIKKSFGRYISMFIIVMIGVGFYAGIQSSSPDFIDVADTYYDEYNLMDFKIVSSMGLSDNDVDALRDIDNVNLVIPSYSLDVLNEDKAIRIHALEESVNNVKLIEGRMPTNNTECVADNKNYKIGDIIEITSDVSEELANHTFTVVGTVESVLYLSADYGSTSIGSGKLSSFIFINKEDFTLEAYTEIYITANIKDATAYSKTYEDIASEINDSLVKLKPYRENARYQEIYDEAMTEISENETKLNDEKSKGETELSDAKDELDEGSKELEDGKVTAKTEFRNAKAELDDNAQKLSDGKDELLQNESDLYATINSQNAEFDNAKTQIANGWTAIDSTLSNYGLSRDTIADKIAELDAAITLMNTQLSTLTPTNPQYSALTSMIAEYTVMLDGLNQLKSSIDTLTSQETALNEGIATFNAEIQNALSQIESGKTEILDNETKLNDGYSQYYSNLAKFNSEIKKNEEELSDGYDEYYDGLETFNTEITDAEKKIADAKTELLTLEHPKWYVFDRDAAVGYTEFGASVDVISSISTVFPIFFILIVMLMTSNTMARMIVEERGELGTLTSLGYTDRNIIDTYLIYVLSASGLGAITGFFAGCRIIPPLIYLTFKFNLPELVVEYNIFTFSIIMLVTIILMSFVTIVGCNQELKQKPAALLRPIPPKHGQKIFLERIGIIWNHLTFTWKVTMRNMFRYKKRAIMIIVGVAGCTSFLLVGFGLKDSMNGVAEKQYGDIITYDNMIVLKDDTADISGNLETLLTEANIIDPLLIRQSAYKCQTLDKSLDAYLIVPENLDGFYNYYHLTRLSDGESLSLDEDSVIVTQKIAELFEAGKGDVITIKDSENNLYDLTISDIAENYSSNYIYMDRALYNKIFEDDISYNMIVSTHDTDEDTIAKHLIDSDLIVNVNFTSDIMEKILEQTESLDGIIVLLVVVASLLALIVLYNLTSINISERTREIATLKVLGFRDNETNSYIYREAIILTIISIGFGLLLGVALHRFVLQVIEGTSNVFFKQIQLSSYVISCILTMFFSLLMQVITYFKLKTINMIESLKSVE